MKTDGVIFMIAIIKMKARQLKKQVVIVHLAYMHKETKWYIKVFLLFVLIYALSPIDLIPDFIPVLGMLDDIILIPLGIILAIKMIPINVWEECKSNAENGIIVAGKYKILGASFIILIWIIILLGILKILHIL
jgi:uncharacterized membrane protein YkvA (DUF1232 family)